MENLCLVGSVIPAVASLQMKDIHDIAFGATLLGAGGGGDPYLEVLQLQQAIDNGANIRLMSVDEVPVNSLVAACGWMGAPTVQKEKYANGNEAKLGLAKLEQVLKRKVDAIFPIEIGGQNGLSPLLLSAARGIPVVDCDGMGRAFPEAQMVTFNIYGCKACPAIFTDEKGNCLVLDSEINQEEERLGRQITIAMGGHCHVIDYPMTGRQLKQYSVHGTLSIARGIGHAVRLAVRNRQDIFNSLLKYLSSTEYYRHVRILFDGKIVDVNSGIQGGFSKGKVILKGLEDKTNHILAVEFQNENLVARRGNKVVASVPDIIAIVDRDSAHPINTENLKYGQRVKVLGISVPPVLRTAEALEVVGPNAFGLNTDYIPVEDLNPEGAGLS